MKTKTATNHNAARPSKPKKPARTEPNPAEYLALGRKVREATKAGESWQVLTYAHPTQGACFLFLSTYKNGQARTKVYPSGETEYIGAGPEPVGWILTTGLHHRLVEDFCTPAVVVFVRGGVADYESLGDVKVSVIDFDNLESGDTHEVQPWEVGLMSAETLAEIEKHNKNNKHAARKQGEGEAAGKGRG